MRRLGAGWAVRWALAGGAALVLASCGGPPRPSKAQFLERGNAICARANASIQAAGAEAFPGGRSPLPPQLARFARTTVVAGVASQLRQLRRLRAPDGDDEAVEAILEAADRGLASVRANPALLSGNGGVGPFAAANRLAWAYGLTACAA